MTSIYNLSLDLNPIFWKRLFNQKVTIDELKDVDKYRYDALNRVLDGIFYDVTTFEADFGDGIEVEICEGGSQIDITNENKAQYVELYLKKYLEQDEVVH